MAHGRLLLAALLMLGAGGAGGECGAAALALAVTGAGWHRLPPPCAGTRGLRGGGLDDLDGDSDPAACADADPADALAPAHRCGVAAGGGAARQLHCPMTMNTIGTAAPGLFFDVEAVASDILISGLDIATEETAPVEFAGPLAPSRALRRSRGGASQPLLLACDPAGPAATSLTPSPPPGRTPAVYTCSHGSWLDAEFARIQTPRAWTCIMQVKPPDARFALPRAVRGALPQPLSPVPCARTLACAQMTASVCKWRRRRLPRPPQNPKPGHCTPVHECGSKHVFFLLSRLPRARTRAHARAKETKWASEFWVKGACSVR
jgi:hypothetical protein